MHSLPQLAVQLLMGHAKASALSWHVCDLLGRLNTHLSSHVSTSSDAAVQSVGSADSPAFAFTCADLPATHPGRPPMTRAVLPREPLSQSSLRTIRTQSWNWGTCTEVCEGEVGGQHLMLRVQKHKCVRGEGNSTKFSEPRSGARVGGRDGVGTATRPSLLWPLISG